MLLVLGSPLSSLPEVSSETNSTKRVQVEDLEFVEVRFKKNQQTSGKQYKLAKTHPTVIARNGFLTGLFHDIEPTSYRSYFIPFKGLSIVGWGLTGGLW